MPDIGQSIDERVAGALKDSEARTRAILDAAVDAIITIDSRGTIETANPAAERLFGYSPAEMIGQNVRMLMPSPYKEEHDGYLQNYLTTGQKRIIGLGREVEGRRKDGVIFPMHLAVSELLIGDRRMFTGIARDITRLRDAIRKLEESESRTRAILQSAADAIITIDEKGRIESINPTGERLFGYAAAEVVSRNINMLMPSPFREEHDGYLQNYLQTGQKKIIGIGREVVGLRKDGTTFPMELSVSEVHHSAGRQYTGIVRDISARKVAEDQLKFYADELQQRNLELTRSNEELERFTYTVSHDLKSPLVTIKGFLGRLEKHIEAGDQNQVADALRRISNAAERMRQLLDELLQFSRIGRIVHPFETFRFGDLAREAIELCSGPIRERGISVSVSPGDALVRGDRVRLREAVQNLIENSVKFTANLPAPHLIIGIELRDRGRVYFIRDNGIGIDPQYHQKVFGLFEQLSRDSGGSGIGLALVRRIIETHDGEVWIESEGLGKGCTVCFTLPEARALTESLEDL